MTKRIFSFLLVLIFFSPSCVKVQKDVHSYYPQVKTVSATVNKDGSVTVTGQVTFEGRTSIQYCGFCMDTTANPDMLTNQLLSDSLIGNVFSCTYTSLSAVQTYYFRAFAANVNGYAIGSAVSVSHAGFDTSLIPCHPRAQYMVLTGTSNQTDAYTYVDSVTPSATGYEVLGHTGSHSIDIVFGQYPISGVYTNASVRFDAIIVTGVTLYVQQISRGAIDITICQANVQVQNMFTGVYYPYVMTTKFRSPS